MGMLGRPSDRAVQDAIFQGIATVKAAGKAAGTLTSDRALAHEYLKAGAQFVAVGVDTTILVNSAKALAAEFKTPRRRAPE
jgi:4-hydroxy-2-oxoheptanedioate aldolase